MTLNKKLVIIFASLFAIFALLALFVNTVEPDNKTVVITVDKKEYKVIDLKNEQEFDITTKYGINKILVKDEEIYIKSATCPDKLCVRHGKLHNKYDSIVCLPNRVVIEYRNETDIDAVSGR